MNRMFSRVSSDCVFSETVTQLLLHVSMGVVMIMMSPCQNDT